MQHKNGTMAVAKNGQISFSDLSVLFSLSTQKNTFSSKTPYSTVFALHGSYLDILRDKNRSRYYTALIILVKSVIVVIALKLLSISVHTGYMCLNLGGSTYKIWKLQFSLSAGVGGLVCAMILFTP